MKWINRRTIRIACIAAGVLFFLLLFLWLMQFLASNEFESFIKSLGSVGPLALMFYLITSHVFAPLAGTPALVVGVTVFGLPKAMLYIYLGSMASAVINFFISRKFGRHLVIKLAGKRAMKKIDEFAQESGAYALIFARIFGVSFFEIISYAAGLSAMKFSTYFALTLVFHGIPTFALLYAFESVNISSPFFLSISVGSMVAVGIVFAIIFRFWQRKREQKRKLSRF